MFTRCPECQAVHALSAAMLAQSSGRLRCGRCDHVYNALASLFDEWPDSGEVAPGFDAASPEPIAGSTHLPPPDEISDELAPPESEVRPGSRIWGLALAVLAVLTLINLGWTFRDRLSEFPHIRQALESVGFVDLQVDAPFRDLSMIHLVSRDLHQHPTLAGMLALSATFVSRAPRAQPYPAIELTLTDAGNNPVARRQFQPSEYLPGGNVPGNGLAPGVHVPVLLEFADPGSQVSGFYLEFH